jgi:SAM-dependent methyltransferase
MSETTAWLGQAAALWLENPQAFDLIRLVLGGADHSVTAPTGDKALEIWGKTFDHLAETSPEGGVALYALGNPDLLRLATDEVVERLKDWGLLDPTAAVLEIGCGIGRFAKALAPFVGHLTGLDISSKMIARAQERCAGLTNVTLQTTSGRNLAELEDATMDLVLAVDVFPYLVQAGRDVVERQFIEVARVLRPGAELVIFNYSYRNDIRRDLAELEAAAKAHDLTLVDTSDGKFMYWDASSFRLRRP